MLFTKNRNLGGDSSTWETYFILPLFVFMDGVTWE